MVGEVATRLHVDADAIDTSCSFERMGLDSLALLELAADLEAHLGRPVPASIAEFRTIDAVVAHFEDGAEEAPAPAPAPAAPRPPSDALTKGQEALWFLHELDPHGAAYNESVACRLDAGADAEALRAAVQGLVDRHEALRTTYPSRDGRPVREVHDRQEADFAVLDAGTLDAEVRRPFDLEAGPVLRARLLRGADGGDVLLLVAHHIAVDGWSFDLLLSELGAPPAATDPAVPFGDVVGWEEDLLADDARVGPLWDFWSDRLAGPLPVLDLPSDAPRGEEPSEAAGSHDFTVDPGVAAALRALARDTDATLYAVLLAAYATLLQRHARQDDVIVGMPAIGGARPAHPATVGYLVNPLPLRLDLADDPSFAALVAQAGAAVNGALAHQALPFPALVDRLRPPRAGRRSPIFSTWIVLQQPRHSDGLAATAFRPPPPAVKFDLELELVDVPDRLTGRFIYRAELFSAAAAALLAERFVTLLAGAAADPSAPLSRLPLVPAAERQALLVERNATDAPVPDAALHALVEAQVDRTPDAVAIAAPDGTLTYRELDERANRVAHDLAERGVARGDRVAVFMERATTLNVALLGILKAGAAYVPVDPEYPPERARFMLEDSGARVVLTQAHVADRVPSAEAAVVTVAGDERSATRPAIALDGADLAYVIYTSGSTGTPKGVMNTHAGIVNRLAWMQDAYRLTGADTVLHKTPFTFDVSVWELFWPLLAGARMLVAPPGAHRDPERLAELVQAEGATVAHFVPSMLKTFLDDPGAERCRSLRLVVCSGEALPAELARRCLALLPDARLENLYGPTEAAVDVSAHSCDPASLGATVPIGRPIWNTRLYVLDAHREPVPTGAIGELYISGIQVARGYVNRPELTAERFVENPFAEDPSERMYRTGDLARLREDGEIEFLGRIDDQVKLRGHRIELGEVEAHLRRHPAVTDAAAIVRPDRTGEPRLLGYVVTAPGASVTGRDVRALAAEHLPAAHVPARVLVLEAMPVTHNGKLDRAALPEPADVADEARPAGRPPRTELERVIAAAWADVLELDAVGCDDAFFDLGGNSMLLARVRERLQADLGRDLRLVELLERPTVAALAAHLSGPEPATDEHTLAHAGRERGRSRAALLRARRGTNGGDG